MNAANSNPMDSSNPLQTTEFDALLIDIQPRLRAYLSTLLGSWTAVDDIAQEVNMVLIQKRDSFREDGNFVAWAFRVAYFKATTWRRDMQREGRVMLSETFFQYAASIAEAQFTETTGIHDALRHCLEKLPQDDRKLLQLKYVDRICLTKHAEAGGRKANALHKSVSRIRLALRQCIQRQLDKSPPTPHHDHS